ncbi:MAG: hypothetical protein LBR43_01780 [Spiroplasmataceae bacterium]|nr:hypothetical protein [Spiroplasmataceae bacterium]
MTKRNKENIEINQVKTLSNSKYNFSREAEIIEGNAATGEQYSLKRVIYSEVPITPELAKRYLDEMGRQIKQLRAENPYQVISAVSYENMGGNQVIKFTPTTELIFPDRIPIFDEDGYEIIGEANIRAEVKRREDQWAEWERTGQLQESVEIHHTDDGKMVRIKFRAAPIKRHPNDTGASYSYFDSAKNKLLGWYHGEPESNKKPKTQEDNVNSMDVDLPKASSIISENVSSKKTSILLSDEEIEKASKEQLIDLINKLKAELRIRERINVENSSQTYECSTASSQELRNELQKCESRLNSFQTPSDINSNSNVGDKFPIGGVISLISVLGVFSVGGLVLVRRKISIKNKKSKKTLCKKYGV